MNDKLVRRAALKYRDWMISKVTQQPQYRDRTIRESLSGANDKVVQMQAWANRFLNSTTPRLQQSFWDEDKVHVGILNTNVYRHLAEKLIPEIGHDVVNNIQHALATLKIMTEHKTIIPLSVKDAINEVRIVSEAWEDVKFRNDVLSVLIKDVTLKDDDDVEVALGSFWIHLKVTSPLTGLSIESVNKIESESGLYHPHVRRNNLCEGEGEDLMKEALCQGRLEDYFRIVEAILRTYNGASPYEPLSDWYAPEDDHENEFYCDGCGEWRSNDESVYCEGCDTQYCECCAGGGTCTECDNWRCDNCSTSCGDCGETICNRCSVVCAECKTSICPACGVQCVTCDDTHCSSCTKSCTGCGNMICKSCDVSCGCCGDSFCEDCLSETCTECKKDICKSCETTCDECDRTICESCADNTCKHCGVTVCGSCDKDHSCLLEGISN